jgi:hypothetical protein
VSARLSSEGVPHALVGGLAVAAHGWDRATTDVDFLVPQAALTKMTNRPQIVRITELVDGVRVDTIATDEALLEEAIREAKGAPPLVPLPALVYVRLKTGWRRDQTDIVELVKHGAVKVELVHGFIERAGDPDLLHLFDELVQAADSEPK